MTPQKTAAAPAATVEASPSLLDRIAEESAREQARVSSRYKPVMSTDEMIAREEALTYLVERIMREGIDYGWVPGTKPREDPKPGEYQAKPTLFKAGAERACAFFGYAPQFAALEKIEEWTSDKYGEPLFYFEYQCTLSKDGAMVGSGIGSGSTWESKYRYRNADRTCPECGKSTIIKGREEYGGGWLCFAKKGGCGVKYADDDESIAGQQIGQRPNPDIADVVNTVQKMAQKRSYVAATLTATGLSGRFTQDLEDMPSAAEATPQAASVDRGTPKPAPAPQRNTKAQQQALAQQRIAEESHKAAAGPAPAAAQATSQVPEEIQALWREMGTSLNSVLDRFARFKRDFGELFGDEEQYYRILQKHGMQHANECKRKEVGLDGARRCAREMYEVLQKNAAPPKVEEPPAPFAASDDDIPTALGGTFEPGPAPALPGKGGSR